MLKGTSMPNRSVLIAGIIAMVALAVAVIAGRSRVSDEERRGLRYAVSDDNVGRVLVADKAAQQAMRTILSVKYRVTLVYTARGASALMRAFGYRLVIVRNSGMPPDHAVTDVPKYHANPVIYISSDYNEEQRRICQEKRLRCMDAPVESETLRRAVAEELGQTR